MKRLLTAAVAVTLMCGASAYAYAQDTQPSTTGSSAAAPADPSAPGAMAPGQSGPATGADTPSSAPTPDPGMAPPAGGAAPASPAPDASTPAMGQAANTPDGSAPSSYPRCTSKGQDRCVQGGMAMKSSHHMAKHHHKAKASS